MHKVYHAGAHQGVDFSSQHKSSSTFPLPNDDYGKYGFNFPKSEEEYFLQEVKKTGEKIFAIAMSESFDPILKKLEQGTLTVKELCDCFPIELGVNPIRFTARTKETRGSRFSFGNAKRTGIYGPKFTFHFQENTPMMKCLAFLHIIGEHCWTENRIILRLSCERLTKLALSEKELIQKFPKKVGDEKVIERFLGSLCKSPFCEDRFRDFIIAFYGIAHPRNKNTDSEIRSELNILKRKVEDLEEELEKLKSNKKGKH